MGAEAELVDHLSEFEWEIEEVRRCLRRGRGAPSAQHNVHAVLVYSWTFGGIIV